ncbi:hypothetical protein [Hymenobacter sublimis]|uniref:STAS/SEC14 domain-containing protein n=1 Tax=Hymenobacter sublimis TaxID=2933777 RepID=A0ABY4JBD2_9BACT|nr:hypothetical protein [Hymenobacter sublimis]UPL49257.1 hypothetical protein MWH26_19025 [Hymenobacter sublimis]
MVSPAISDYLQVTHRVDLDVLIVRWLRQPTSQELHEGYRAVLAIAQQPGCRYWLVDGRRRTNANQQGVAWMMETFLPLVMARLGGQVFMAYLFVPNHLAELEADASVPPLTYFDNLPYHIRRFADEQPAMAWLAECRVTYC